MERRGISAFELMKEWDTNGDSDLDLLSSYASSTHTDPHMDPWRSRWTHPRPQSTHPSH